MQVPIISVITSANYILSINEELKQKMRVKAHRKGDLINVTNSTGKIRSSRWMPKHSRDIGKKTGYDKRNTI